MSLPSVVSVAELTSFKPNKSDPNDTKTKQVKALEILGAVKGVKSIAFEGVAREDPDVTVRCVDWENLEARKDFTQSATYQEFQKKLEGTSIEQLYSRTYNLFGSLEKSLAKKPECIEYVVFNLKNDVKFVEFFKEWSEGLKAVEACPGCCPVVLGQQTDNKAGVVQIQGWMTLEDHIPNFKIRSDIDAIMAPLTATVGKYVEGGWSGFKAYHLLLNKPGEAL